MQNNILKDGEIAFQQRQQKQIEDKIFKDKNLIIKFFGEKYLDCFELKDNKFYLKDSDYYLYSRFNCNTEEYFILRTFKRGKFDNSGDIYNIADFYQAKLHLDSVIKDNF